MSGEVLRSVELDAITMFDHEGLRAIGYTFHADIGAEGVGAVHATKEDRSDSLCGLRRYDRLALDGNCKQLTCVDCIRRGARILKQSQKRVRRDHDNRFNPSNTPGTCLYCGWKLRQGRDHLHRGVFCTGTCAQLFGHSAARAGFRFEPRNRVAGRRKP